MDCRTSLVLALGLAVGLAGCATAPDMKSKTEVAFADFNVREAASNRALSPKAREAVYDKARAAYQHALELDPSCRDAYAGLGRLQAAAGNEDRAAEVYRKALKKFPRDAGLWYDLGQCQCRRKDWPAALDSLQKAHLIDPDNRGYTRALGLTLAVAGRPKESVALLGPVMGQAEANYAVARMLHDAGKDDLGRPYLQAALQLNPNLGGSHELCAQTERGAAPAAGRPVVNIGFAGGDGEARQ
jgi:tetratricopeptide (TPR) repeat protein